MNRLAILLAVIVGLWPLAAGAHVTATGLAVVTVDDQEVSYRLTVVPSELPAPAEGMLYRAGSGDRDAAERLAEAARRAVLLQVDGAPCRPGRLAIRGDSGGLKFVIDYALDCPAAPGRLDFQEDWGELFGAHYQTVTTISGPQGSLGEHLLGEGSRLVSLDFGVPPPSGLGGFVRLGVEHILTGYDHLLFLLALLIGASSFWRVLGIASAFTLAHSITLSLAVLDLVHVPGRIVEPLIAGSIVWVAVENMVGGSRRWRRYAVTFAFGLVHGLGFADALQPLALSGWALARALFGFNLGVELGQAVAIALVLPVLIAVGRAARSVPVDRYASLAVAAAGAWWLVERVGFG